jgi:hypothetical protein
MLEPYDGRLSYGSLWGKGLRAPHNKVTIAKKRHSGMLLAGIHKSFLDTGLKHAGMTKGNSDTHL